MTFLDRAVAREFAERPRRSSDPRRDIDEAINDAVDEWHSLYAGQTVYPPLHDWLGLTWAEYGRWVMDPKSLTSIVRARRSVRMLADLAADREDLRALAREWSVCDADGLTDDE